MYDIIVVGGGPGGSTAAARLSRQGARVLLLEARKMPRVKICAGAVSAKIAGGLGEGFSRLVHDEMREMVFTYRGERPVSHVSREPYAYGVVREEFDQYLFEMAAAAGAEVHDDEKVTAVEETTGGFSVRTERDRYISAFLIGADGATSLVARSFGLARKRFGVALETRIPLEAADSLRGKALVGLGIVPNGYGWVFPKRDHLNVGIGTFAAARVSLKEKLKDYIALVFPGYAGKWTAAAHPIPMVREGERLARGRAAVVGDAAGLVDPFFGEGIAWAVLSGELAAAAIASGPGSDLEVYEQAVRREILQEFKEAGRLGRLFYTLTGFLHRHVLMKGKAVERFSRVVSGNLSYRDFNRWVRREAWKEIFRAPAVRQ